MSVTSTRRLLYLALAIAPLFAYLEWGGGNHGFLFQMERDILISKGAQFSSSMLHPAVLLPLLGQLLLIIAAALPKPNRRLALVGVVLLSLLVGFILLIGVLGLSLKIILSTLPFVVLVVMFWRMQRN